MRGFRGMLAVVLALVLVMFAVPAMAEQNTLVVTTSGLGVEVAENNLVVWMGTDGLGLSKKAPLQTDGDLFGLFGVGFGIDGVQMRWLIGKPWTYEEYSLDARLGLIAVASGIKCLAGVGWQF